MKRQKRTNNEDNKITKYQSKPSFLVEALDTICNSGKLSISIQNTGIDVEYNNGCVEFSTRIKNSNSTKRNDTEDG